MKKIIPSLLSLGVLASVSAAETRYFYQCSEVGSNGLTPPAPLWISQDELSSTLASGVRVKDVNLSFPVFHDAQKDAFVFVSDIGKDEIAFDLVDAASRKKVGTYTCKIQFRP